MIYTFLAGILIVSAALTGPLILRTWVVKDTRYIISFSIGVFITVTYGLFLEAVRSDIVLSGVLISTFLGGLFLVLASRLMSIQHHHHSIDHHHTHSLIDARRLLFINGIHNVIDGLLLVPAFLIDTRVGIAATVAIFAHEIVKKMSEFFILVESGYSRTRAFLLNVLASATIFIGIIIGLLVRTDTSLNISYFTAFAAGAFIYVVCFDLLPGTLSDARHNEKTRIPHLLSLLLGIGLILSIGFLIPEVSL